MHWIQRHILKELATADTLRYTELKPDSVEGNLFQYHSRELQKQGLIEKNQDGYILTDKGKGLVANLSLTRDMKRRVQPRVVTMIAAENDAGEQLLFRWSRQPYRGRVSLPGGRLAFGEDLYDAAADQLYYKTGYAAELEYIGTVDIKNPHDHIIAQVFRATELSGTHGSDGLTGESFWGRLDHIPLHEQLRGTAEVFAWVKDPKRTPLLVIHTSTDVPAV